MNTAETAVPTAVNADTYGGTMKIDVVDGQGRPVDGFNPLRMVGMDQTKHPIQWTKSHAPSGSALYVTLEKAKLHALYYGD